MVLSVVWLGALGVGLIVVVLSVVFAVIWSYMNVFCLCVVLSWYALFSASLIWYVWFPTGYWVSKMLNSHSPLLFVRVVLWTVPFMSNSHVCCSGTGSLTVVSWNVAWNCVVSLFVLSVRVLFCVCIVACVSCFVMFGPGNISWSGCRMLSPSLSWSTYVICISVCPVSSGCVWYVYVVFSGPVPANSSWLVGVVKVMLYGVLSFSRSVMFAVMVMFCPQGSVLVGVASMVAFGSWFVM